MSHEPAQSDTALVRYIPKIFRKHDGTPITFFVDVRIPTDTRLACLSRIKARGGSIVTRPADASFIIVFDGQGDGQLLARSWSNVPGKHVLVWKWIHDCAKEDRIMGPELGWGGHQVEITSGPVISEAELAAADQAEANDDINGEGEAGYHGPPSNPRSSKTGKKKDSPDGHTRLVASIPQRNSAGPAGVDASLPLELGFHRLLDSVPDVPNPSEPPLQTSSTPHGPSRVFPPPAAALPQPNHTQTRRQPHESRSNRIPSTLYQSHAAVSPLQATSSHLIWKPPLLPEAASHAPRPQDNPNAVTPSGTMAPKVFLDELHKADVGVTRDSSRLPFDPSGQRADTPDRRAMSSESSSSSRTVLAQLQASPASSADHVSDPYAMLVDGKWSGYRDPLFSEPDAEEERRSQRNFSSSLPQPQTVEHQNTPANAWMRPPVSSTPRPRTVGVSSPSSIASSSTPLNSRMPAFPVHSSPHVVPPLTPSKSATPDLGRKPVTPGTSSSTKRSRDYSQVGTETDLSLKRRKISETVDRGRPSIPARSAEAIDTPQSSGNPATQVSPSSAFFRFPEGTPYKFWVQPDLKGRAGLLQACKRHGGEIVTHMPDCNFVILSMQDGKESSKKVLKRALQERKKVLKPSWITVSDEAGSEAPMSTEFSLDEHSFPLKIPKSKKKSE